MYKNYHKGRMMTFTDQEVYNAVKHYLPQVNEYVKSHGGKIKLLGVKDNTVYIKLSGACHGCSLSLMTTKLVVEKSLRDYIDPRLVVINVDGKPENQLPETYYIDPEDQIELNKTTKERLLSAIKKFF
ncbi:NifU family protein [Sulfurospirillum sp. 1612]|uniref:NifU family protein n=1 Tax=Sulfurospirillum sp. 1612 TaxID=3094835 RepID=UPI002F91FF6A